MTNIDFYIFSGQSNTGAASLDNALDPYPAGNTQYLPEMDTAWISNKYIDKSYYGINLPRIKKVYLSKNTGILQSGAGDDCKTFFGPEVSFAYDIKPVFILKYGLNNTAIAGWIANDSTKHRFKSAIYQAMQQAYITGYNLDLKGFVWIHGESDALALATANAYDDNMTTMFDLFETHYTAMCTKLGFTNRVATYKKLIFETKSAATYLAELEASKLNFVSGRANSLYWQVDDYDLRYDSLHYTAAAYLQMGLDLSAYYKNGTIPVWFD